MTTKFVSKPWGYEEWLVNNDLYCGKILFVKKDKYCSYHYHKLKTETFYLLNGKIRLIYGTSNCAREYYHDIKNSLEIELSHGDSFHIPVGMPHRFTALEDSKIIEISTHHEDSDSIRILPSCPVE